MSSVDDYLKNISPSKKLELEKIRKKIKEIVPESEETLSYGMPVFKYKGKYLIGVAAFKNHISIFPGSEPIEKLKDKLVGFKISKGTIQFSEQNRISDKLLKEILEYCRMRNE